MENSAFTFLSKLQNIITFNNIEFLKESYIMEKFKKHEEPINLNKELGILEYYDSFTNDHVSLKFENYLKELLWNETLHCIEAIDNSLILLDSIQKRKFIIYIEATLNYIEKNQVKLFQKFPICKKPLEELKEYLNKKYDVNITENTFFLNEESLFKIRAGISKIKLIKLYDISIKYEIIDDEFISQECFLSVLLDKVTNHKIIFNCKNSISAMYLHTISEWFDNLNPKSIESSGRFYTKGGKKHFTKSNYYKSKSIIADEDRKIINNLTLEFQKLNIT